LPLFALAASCNETVPPGAGDGRPLGTEVVVTDELELDNLQGPVDVVRDSFGVVHIFATSPEDALRVQAYQVGRDRHAQVELIRRTAEGRMAEVFGDVSPDLVDDDIAQRTLGLHRVGKVMYEKLDPNGEEKAWLDAYADGLTQYGQRLQAGDESLPRAIVGMQPKFFTPWTGADSLAVARLQSAELSFDANDDVERQELADAVRSIFSPTAMDPERARRSGLLRDVLRWAPLDPATPLMGFPNDPMLQKDQTGTPPAGPSGKPTMATMRLPRALLASTRGWRNAVASGTRIFGDYETRGSNDWIVGKEKSATGNPLVANDPHLSLSSPAVFWMVDFHVVAKDPAKSFHAGGMAFPGIPGIILGFNENLAWGSTTTGYDVTDVYAEKLTPDGSAVDVDGKSVPIEKIRETIAIAGGKTLDYDVLWVPHHGPIIPNIVDHRVVPPDPNLGALSYRYTGHEPTREISFVHRLVRARNVDEFRDAVRNFEVGSQNWVAADRDGNTFYSTQSRIPKRDPRALAWDAQKYEGTLPMFVLPGYGTCEWKGFIEESFVPHVKNPPEGFLATANGDTVGVTLDNDPSNDKLPSGELGYLGGSFSDGLRQGRIYERLREKGSGFTADDMASIQADVKSPFGARLAPIVALVLAHAEAERTTPGTHPGLAALVADPRYAAAQTPELRDWLEKWGSESGYRAESGVSPDDGSKVADAKEATASKATMLFNTWLVAMGKRTFDDEVALLGGPAWSYPRTLAYLMTTPAAQLATYDATAKESALFDDVSTAPKETMEQQVLLAIFDAVSFLQTRMGPDRDGWRWGKEHTIRFSALVPLWAQLSIPTTGDATFPKGFPRHGDNQTVDPANYGTRPGKLDGLRFGYGRGPVQRFVGEMTKDGPVVKNVLPGGNVWSNEHPNFKDDAERWRRNQNRPFWFWRADVVKDAKERITYWPRGRKPPAAK
jgi:penicillin amidase